MDRNFAELVGQGSEHRGAAMRVLRRLHDIGGVIVLGIAVAMAAAVAVTMSHAPEIGSNMQRLIADDIAAENRSFREKHGLASDTQEFAICERDLSQIRASHEKRISQFFDMP